MATPNSRELVEGIIKLPKQEAILLLEAGYMLSHMQRNKEAYELFKGIAALLPDSEVPNVALGHLFLGQGKLQVALKEYKEALRREPESLIAKTYMAEIFIIQNRYDEARLFLEDVIACEDENICLEYAKTLLSYCP